MFQNVLFDLDGTLTDSYEAIVTSLEYALEKKGITPRTDEKTRRSYIGPSLVYSCENIYGADRNLADEIVAEYRRVYREGNMFKVSIYEGIPQLLENLAKAGVRMFVATSKPEEFAVAILEKIGLAGFFEKIQAPSFKTCEQGKDDLINSIIKEFKLDPAQCLMIGDTRFDIEGGIKAGVKTMGVTYGYPGEGDFLKADYTVSHPSEIESVVLGGVRNVRCSVITEKIAGLCQNANYFLNPDIENALKKSLETETNPTGKNILQTIIENAEIAREKKVAICQDTGMTLVFAEVGQDVHITDGSITDAINEGVKKGYTQGYLRSSVVEDPLRRKNTGDNTPAIIYYDLVPGNKIKLTVLPKGFGSENMSAVKMLKPSMGEEGVCNFVVETVKSAGPNPCPPVVIGVGIGGSMDKAAVLSKKALERSIDKHNEDAYYANMEKKLLERINKMDIGPAGLGGTTTALGVNIETYPTHIAGLPVAVTVSCHVTRHASGEI